MLRLVCSFLDTRSVLGPCKYVSTEPIDCILLSSFKLTAILLIFSVKPLCFSIFNLCCVSFIFFYMIYFFLYLSCFQTVLIIFKFTFSFYDTIFCAICFFIFTTIIYWRYSQEAIDFYLIQWKNCCLAASDLYCLFTESNTFCSFHYRVLKRTDFWKRWFVK